MFYRAPYFGMPRLIGAMGEDLLTEVVSRLHEAAKPGIADWATGLLASSSPEVDVLRAILGNSPFLSRTVIAEPDFFRELIGEA
jgi:hypothetical protein